MFCFRSEKHRIELRSALRKAIEFDQNKIAKIIFSKFGESAHLISTEPNTNVFLQRYFEVCNYLEAKSAAEETKKAEHRFFKEKLSRLLDPKTSTESPTLQSFSDDSDCPICFDEMCHPKKVYSCNNVFRPHFICSECLANLPKKECPSCKEDFKKRKPKRWPNMENNK